MSNIQNNNALQLGVASEPIKIDIDVAQLPYIPESARNEGLHLGSFNTNDIDLIQSLNTESFYSPVLLMAVGMTMIMFVAYKLFQHATGVREQISMVGVSIVMLVAFTLMGISGYDMYADRNYSVQDLRNEIALLESPTPISVDSQTTIIHAYSDCYNNYRPFTEPLANHKAGSCSRSFFYNDFLPHYFDKKEPDDNRGINWQYLLYGLIVLVVGRYLFKFLGSKKKSNQ